MSSSGDRRRRSGDRHGWNDLEHYLNIHFAQVDRLGEYFVEADDLDIYLYDDDTLRIEGRIRCQHGIFLDVAKTLEFNDRNQVRTIRYKYHAGIEGDQSRPIFRYDNAHPHPGHADEHHKHRFDHSSWQEIEPPEWTGRERWPTLAEVLDELYEWWQETGALLGFSR